VVEIITTIVCAVYALIVGLGWATPANLLVFTFLIGAAGAMTVPAWQAVVTYLVPRDDLPPAIAANSVGVNISRAIGPALGGLTISAYGIVAPFWINAASNLGIVASLLWWRPRNRAGTLLPAERFGQAILAGLRYARHNRHLRATLRPPAFSCSSAPIGRYCRWSPASKSAAVPTSTACCLASSAPARLSERFCCLGPKPHWEPIA
jgi:MFS family permease